MQGPIRARGTFIDLKLGCRDLSTLDGIPPSSFVVVYAQTTGKSEWTELNRSETIAYSPSPDYNRIFQVEYRFELYQEIRVVVFHRNSESENLHQQTLLGVADCPLGRIVSSHAPVFQLPITNTVAGQQQHVGTVFITAEEVVSTRKLITLSMNISQIMTPEDRSAQRQYLNSAQARADELSTVPTGSLLTKRGAGLVKRFRGGIKQKTEKTNIDQINAALPAHMANEVNNQKAQHQAAVQEVQQATASLNAPSGFYPFVSILQAPAGAIADVKTNPNEIAWEEVFKSDDIPNYYEKPEGFSIPPIKLSEFDLTDGDENRVIKIAVVRRSPGVAGQIVGEHITTFPALRRSCVDQTNVNFQLQPMGKLVITKYEEEEKPSFYDYLRGGWCDFGLITGIDFTSSNGNQMHPSSRHFLHSGAPNEYEAAMRTVGNMLASYSSDDRIPAFGFGAKIGPNQQVSHCFPVSTQGDALCQGVDGLIHAYKSTLQMIQLYGPTMFSQLLQKVILMVSYRQKAAQSAGNSTLAYTVLLILTDGEISDYDATLEKLIVLSRLPVSVVIIGLGNEDFSKMRLLDSSNGPLRRGIETASRSFVQFVPYNEFRGDLSLLAEKVLGHIPEQVIGYIEYQKNARGVAQSNRPYY